MNPKRHVCKISNNFQKLGWCSDNQLSSGDSDTELQTYTARCKPLTSTTNRKARLEFAKKHKESEVFWNCVYGPMRQRWTFDPKQTASPVKHGGGVVIAWAYMTVSGTDPLIFTDDLMHDDSSRMNLEGYKTILPSNIQENATRVIRKCFILYQDNDRKHPASSVKEFIRAKKWKVLDCPSPSPDLNLIEHECDRLKRRVKTETVGIGSIKVWESILKDETESLVMSMCHRLTAVIIHKGSATK